MNGIAIASPSEDFMHRLHAAFEVGANGAKRYWRDGLQTTDLPALAEEVAESDPKVVLVGPGFFDAAALQLVEAIDHRYPEIVTLLVAPPSPELWPAAVRAGARDIISPDASGPELREAVEHALHAADLRREHLRAEPSTDRARVISVISPKGGSGKTTVATNLAVGLAQLAPGKVALLDLDLQFGGVAGALQLTPEHSIADAARAGTALDAATLKVFLCPHPLGLFALCAPESLARADDVHTEHLSRVVSLLADDFRYVVVDTGGGIDVVTLAAIEFSTDLVLVTTTDVACVRALRRAVDALDTLSLNRQIRHLVLNRADSKRGLSAADIEAVTGAEIDVAVPTSDALALSLNLGIPILESDPKSPAAKAFRELAGPFVRSSIDAVDLAGHTGRRLRWRRSDRA